MRPVYFEDGALKLIDQTLLPTEEVIRSYTDYRAVGEAIVTMVVRGAPAIGVTAGYAVALAAREFASRPRDAFLSEMDGAMAYLRGTRPTAVNLFWAIDRMDAALKDCGDGTPEAVAKALMAEADAICAEDIAMCRVMGAHGAKLIHRGDTILTHCNAGALATADYGTALGVIRAAWEDGKNISVYADETRPLLQGARLTAQPPSQGARLREPTQYQRRRRECRQRRPVDRPQRGNRRPTVSGMRRHRRPHSRNNTPSHPSLQ